MSNGPHDMTMDLFAVDPTPEVLGSQPPIDPPGKKYAAEPWPDDAAPLGGHMERAYLEYAMSVVMGRALPNGSDGLKPVQLRVLHAMNEMRLSANAKHVKSARVVGDVIGKYHPHGDQSVYDTTVRMAQSFSLRYPLVDGQGNFGSLDGDGAAAMRYTECRLTPIAELLLGELSQGTVDFRPNYDGSYQEPCVLPAQLPMLLLNGASGIAVGMATEVPSHNLREVVAALRLLLENDAATLDDVLKVLPGPDLPGGAQLSATADEIKTAYVTGRGSLKTLARWHFEELADGDWRAVVDELPHGISCAKVLSEIEGLTNPQPKPGKKDLSLDQKTSKQLILSKLETARDESSEEAPIRIALEPKSASIPRDDFMQTMVRMTSLSANLPVNLTLLDRKRRPGTKPLLDILKEWLEFRFEVVERRTRHRLRQVDDRLHILEGRSAVLLRIDEVIKIIREADEPKSALIASFGLSERQANDVLDIRLRALARLEAIKLEAEAAALQSERATLSLALSSKAELAKVIDSELIAAKTKYGDDRRTLIREVAATEQYVAAHAPSEPVTVSISRAGWLQVRPGHAVDLKQLTYKAGDSELSVFEATTAMSVCLLDSMGRTYTIRVAEITQSKAGVPMSSLVEFNAKAALCFALCAAPEAAFLFSSSGGRGFVSKLGEALGRNRAGKQFMKLEGGEMPLRPIPFAGKLTAAVSSVGRLVVFDSDTVNWLPGGKGVTLQKLGEGESMVAVACGDSGPAAIVGKDGKAMHLSTEDFDKCRLSRASKGSYVARKLTPTGLRLG